MLELLLVFLFINLTASFYINMREIQILFGVYFDATEDFFLITGGLLAIVAILTFAVPVIGFLVFSVLLAFGIAFMFKLLLYTLKEYDETDYIEVFSNFGLVTIFTFSLKLTLVLFGINLFFGLFHNTVNNFGV